MAALPKSEQKRRRILQAALQVFAREGLHKGTIAEVARLAEVAKGTVYEYFPSKEALFDALLENYFLEMLERATALLQPGQTPAEQLRSIMHYAFKILQESPPEVTLLLTEIWAQACRRSHFNAASNPLREVYEHFLNFLQPLIEQVLQSRGLSLNPRQVAIIFMAITDGVGLYSLLIPDLLDYQELERITLQLMLGEQAEGRSL